MKKHAYLYMVHEYNKVLKTSLKLIDDERNNIYIHVDKKSSEFPFDKIKDICKKSRLVFVDRTNVFWGGRA